MIHTRDQIKMPSSSYFYQIMQRMTTSDVDRIVQAKLKTKHTKRAEKDLMNMLKTVYADASAGLMNELDQRVENVLTEMTLNGTLDNPSIRHLERQSQTPEFMHAFTQRVLNSKIFTHLLAVFVKKQMDNTMFAYRLTNKEEAHLTGTKVDRTVPSSLTKLFSCDGFLVPVHRELQRAPTRKHKQEERTEKNRKYVAP